MNKIQEAQTILKALGLPPAQCNEASALTLLSLAQLEEETPWSQARCTPLRIHDILVSLKNHYQKEYAENSRETIRRQTLHQFIQAGLVVRNPDDPARPTNHPKNCYALTDQMLQVIKTFGSSSWETAAAVFTRDQGTLVGQYQHARQQVKIPLHLADGSEYYLSPGKHNELQVQIIMEFGQRFAPGATLVYLGDAETKVLVFEKQVFEQLAVPLTSHDKLPDVVLWDSPNHRLFLIEAVTSHGPVSPKRHIELLAFFKNCSAECIFVSAFQDQVTFRSFVLDIAWETEVWIADIPEHMIHFNGDHFLKKR